MYEPNACNRSQVKTDFERGILRLLFQTASSTLLRFACIRKKKMEEWALQNPSRRKIIRAGSFFSQSVRGITILLQRMGKKSQDPDLHNLLKLQKESGLNFPDFFLDYVSKQEEASFSSRFPNVPFRLTSQDDLKKALISILEGESAPIVSLVGDWVWTENSLPDMPEYLKKF